MMDEENPQEVIVEDSTTAENIQAWKELLSSSEAKEFAESFLDKCTVLFGQTPSQKWVALVSQLSFMVVAFLAIGALAYTKLIPEGTTGVLAGIIIGYFFKRN